jgi:glycosyltransferase involved in cell wall biosynthesis
MKVLFVYKYLTLGGVETVLRARLEGLASENIAGHVWFLSDGPGRFLFEGLTESISVGGSLDLQRFLETWEPDLITVIDTEEAIPAIKQASHRPPVVLEIHSPYRENRVYLRRLGSLPIAAAFVPSRYQADLVRTRLEGSIPITIVPNSLCEMFLEPMPEGAPRVDRPIIGWVGRLDEVKDWKTCLDIAEEIRSEGVRFELTMVGEPQGVVTPTDVFKQVNRRGLMDSFRWFRSIPFDRMPAYYDLVRASNGVILSTARYESLGMVLVEAMSRGCVVAAPDQPPINEYVEDGESGVLFAPGGIKAASHRIRRVLGHPTLGQEVGRAARAQVQALFGPAHATPELAAALRTVLAAHRPTSEPSDQMAPNS